MSEQQRGPASPSGRPEFQKRSGSKRPLLIVVAIVAVLAVAGALVFALTRGDSAPSAEPGSGTLTVGLVLEPSNLNVRTTPGVALDQVLIDNVYQGLVGLSSGTLDIEPVLAERYEVSDDGLSYSFTLREGVRFHSGAELEAADVLASLEDTLGAREESIEIASPDAETITLSLASPNSRLLFDLASRDGLILQRDADNDLNSSANGTGPYRLDSWKQGDSITLTQNPDYWGERATLDTAVFRYIPDGNAAVNAALSGDVDVQTAVLPELVGEYDGNADFSLSPAESTDVFTLAFNNRRAPLDDPRVRQALSLAIDQDAILAAINGQGKKLGGPITELEPGYRDLTAVNAYDPVRARELLWEAGHEILTLSMALPNFYGPAAADQLVSQFAAIGVTLEVDEMEFATWIEDVHQNRNYELSFVDHAEPGDFANYANPDYYFGYDSPRVQQLFAEATAATDPERVDELLAEAAAQVADDAVAKWLYNYTPSTAVRTGVSGFPMSNTNSRINLAGVTVEG